MHYVTNRYTKVIIHPDLEKAFIPNGRQHGDDINLLNMALQEPSIVVITQKESEAVGIHQGSTNWGAKISPLLIARGIPASKLETGSTDISFFFVCGAIVVRDYPAQ